MVSAIEFGTQHGSCSEAMEWRRSLSKGATQSDAWLACERGDWLLWQLSHGLTSKQYDRQRPAILRALDRITERAILVTHHSMVKNGVECPEWEVWAFEWVTGKIRSNCDWADWTAEAIAGAAVSSATLAIETDWEAVGATELYMQAEDIRTEIPVWPGTED